MAFASDLETFPAPHGTGAGYRRGCRCTLCKQAQAARISRQRAKRTHCSPQKATAGTASRSGVGRRPTDVADVSRQPPHDVARAQPEHVALPEGGNRASDWGSLPLLALIVLLVIGLLAWRHFRKGY